MIRKTIVLCFAAGLLAVCAAAEVPAPSAASNAGPGSEYVYVKVFRSNMDPEKYEDPVKAAELYTERQRLVKSLHDTKRRTLQENAEARKIRKEINRLLNELTLILESKEEVKRLNRKLSKVDSELDSLPLKSAKAGVKSGDKASPVPVKAENKPSETVKGK